MGEMEYVVQTKGDDGAWHDAATFRRSDGAQKYMREWKGAQADVLDVWDDHPGIRIAPIGGQYMDDGHCPVCGSMIDEVGTPGDEHWQCSNPECHWYLVP